MVHRVAKLFCASACSQIEAMDAEAPHQRLLRKAPNVTGIGASLQSVKKHNLSSRRSMRLMFERYDARLSIDPILLSIRGESFLVYVSAPEISGNRKQVWIPKKWVKIGTQIRLYRRASGLKPRPANGLRCMRLVY